MALKKFRSCSDVGFNMTPMIDCTFQLIIFFILVGQVANDAYAKNVKLVRPLNSQAIPASEAKVTNKNGVIAELLEEQIKSKKEHGDA